MIPAGTYSAVVAPVDTEHGLQSVQFGKSKNKGTLQAAVTFEILAGPQAGQKIAWFGYFTDTTIDRTLESLRICGFKGDDMTTFAAQRPNNEVHIVIEHEEYEGKTRAKVLWVNAPGNGVRVANPLDDKDLRLFGARFKNKLKTIKEVETRPAERQTPPPEAEANGWSGNDVSREPGSDDEALY